MVLRYFCMKNMTHCKKVWNLLFINFKRFCHIIIVSVYPMSIPLNVLISHFSWASICVSVGPRKKAILLFDKQNEVTHPYEEL